MEVWLDCDVALNSLQLPSRVSCVNLGRLKRRTGQVTRVEPYGVLLGVGANRHGLLHIQQVSQFFQRYIDKEEGLKREAGLERGARGVLQQQKVTFVGFYQRSQTRGQRAPERGAEKEETDSNEEEQKASCNKSDATVKHRATNCCHYQIH